MRNSISASERARVVASTARTYALLIGSQSQREHWATHTRAHVERCKWRRRFERLTSAPIESEHVCSLRRSRSASRARGSRRPSRALRLTHRRRRRRVAMQNTSAERDLTARSIVRQSTRAGDQFGRLRVVLLARSCFDILGWDYATAATTTTTATICDAVMVYAHKQLIDYLCASLAQHARINRKGISRSLRSRFDFDFLLKNLNFLNTEPAMLKAGGCEWPNAAGSRVFFVNARREK